MWWVRCVLCLTLVGCADEEAEPEPFDAPPPVALRCDGAPPPAVEREIALDVQWQMIRMGPCGDVLYQEVEPSPTDPVWRTSLVDEAVREPQVIAEASSPVGTTFAPDGKTLVVREPERLSLFDPSSGETQVLAEVAGATLGWVRDAEDPTRVSPVVCADGTARIVDPAGDRELSDDAFSCEGLRKRRPCSSIVGRATVCSSATT